MCEWIYDEEVEGMPFNDLPEDWMCPLCGADKSLLEKLWLKGSIACLDSLAKKKLRSVENNLIS